MQLNFKKYGEGFPLIILHGLLGSLDNWQSIVKALSDSFSVYIVDQRNHGKSPHSDEFNYDILANDLLAFMDENEIKKADFIGHSMGGKTVMHFALLHPERVAKLIVVDIAPYGYSDQHSDIFKVLLSVDLSKMSSREEIQQKIEQRIDDMTTVLFLMKGLTRDENNQFSWRFNVDSLYKNYNLIADFPLHKNSYPHKTLFLKGQNSTYINGTTFGEIARLFPKNELTEIADAGHWLHAENPQGFLNEVKDWLREKKC